MAIVPDTRIGKVEFYEAHLAPWGSNAVAIGLTAAQVTAFADLVKNAREAFDAQQAAADAAKAATQAFYNAVSTMQDDGAGLIRTIKNKAESSGDPNVYVLAQIPPPAPPSVVPPPGTPFDLRVELLQTGAITLSWKCNNPSGTSNTIYEVQRKIGTAAGAGFEIIGGSGTRSFTDESLPLGPTLVMYRITGIRGTTRGATAQFVITFGVGGDGFTVTQQVVDAAQALSSAYNVNIPAPNGNGHGVNGRRTTRV